MSTFPATTAAIRIRPTRAHGARPTSEGDRLLEVIFSRHHAQLLSYCRHMLGSQEEAEDVLQQTFIRVHRALQRGVQPRQPRPWLYAIARNCCLSAIDSRKPSMSLQQDAPSLVGLSEQVHRRAELQDLLGDISKLPEDQRSALLLAEINDLSHAEIAEVVGCPVKKVKALIYQARSALIADRQARETSCLDIREQLAVAKGGELRRGPLRRHLRMCEGCRAYQQAVAVQHRSIAAILPVLSTGALATKILGACGTSGGIAAAQAGVSTIAAGGLTAGSATSGALGGGIAAKMATAAAVAIVAVGGASTVEHLHAGSPSHHANSHARDTQHGAPAGIAQKQEKPSTTAASVSPNYIGSVDSPIGKSKGAAARDLLGEVSPNAAGQMISAVAGVPLAESATPSPLGQAVPQAHRSRGVGSHRVRVRHSQRARVRHHRARVRLHRLARHRARRLRARIKNHAPRATTVITTDPARRARRQQRAAQTPVTDGPAPTKRQLREERREQTGEPTSSSTPVATKEEPGTEAQGTEEASLQESPSRMRRAAIKRRRQSD